MALSVTAAQALAESDLGTSSSPDVDRQTFDALYRRYFPRLVSFCNRRVRDGALAEDLAQETLMRALGHLHDLDWDRPPWPWLKTIASNLIVDHVRKHAREVHCDEALDVPDTTGHSVEDTDLLRRAIGSLPGRQRTAVALRYINDWDAGSAASFLGVTTPAYEQLLFRARRRLRAEYRRLAGEVFGGIAGGATALRDWARRGADRLRQVSARIPALPELTSLSASQLAGGALALIVTIGGPGAAVPASTLPSALPAAAVRARPAATGARRPAERARPHRSERGAPAPPRSGATSARVSGGASAAAGPRTPLQQVTNDGVEQPEDTHVTSVALSPDFDRDHTMFAAGQAECPNGICSSVLFESADGGAQWQRLPARSFDGQTVLLPPTFSASNPRIFAMGRLGLQVSNDAGATFDPAAPGGADYALGSAAVSPAFGSGDPTILIGSQTLMRYHDDTHAIEPEASTAGTGPFDPAFSPAYPADDRIVLGGLGAEAGTGRMTSTVYTCSGAVCNGAPVGTDSLPASVRLPSDFATSNVEVAFTERGLYTSDDGGASFRKLPLPADGVLVRDVAVDSSHTLYVATAGDQGGVLVSTDAGATWAPVSSPLLTGGATSVTAHGPLVVASLPGNGIACSTDAGATWSSRCSPAP